MRRQLLDVLAVALNEAFDAGAASDDEGPTASAVLDALLAKMREPTSEMQRAMGEALHCALIQRDPCVAGYSRATDAVWRACIDAIDRGR